VAGIQVIAMYYLIIIACRAELTKEVTNVTNFVRSIDEQ
jgi:hypothetical protein